MNVFRVADMDRSIEAVSKVFFNCFIIHYELCACLWDPLWFSDLCLTTKEPKVTQWYTKDF